MAICALGKAGHGSKKDAPANQQQAKAKPKSKRVSKTALLLFSQEKQNMSNKDQDAIEKRAEILYENDKAQMAPPLAARFGKWDDENYVIRDYYREQATKPAVSAAAEWANAALNPTPANAARVNCTKCGKTYMQQYSGAKPAPMGVCPKCSPRATPNTGRNCSGCGTGFLSGQNLYAVPGRVSTRYCYSCALQLRNAIFVGEC